MQPLSSSSISPSSAAKPSKVLFATLLAFAAFILVVPTEGLLVPGSSLVVQSRTITAKTCATPLGMARSENSKRTDERDREYRGGPQDDYNQYGGGGQEYDYSGGNLKYGTGKYTQRENDGYSGGVNMSQNGRSMQDAVYREDRDNVERARGRPGYGPGADEIDDPVEGIRDRIMRNRRNDRRGGYGYDDEYDEERGYGSGRGFRDRMGGNGLLRDNLREGRNNRDGGYGGGGYDDYDDFNPKVMGGSSKGRGGRYRSRRSDRRRYQDYDDYRDDRDGMLNSERGGNYNRLRREGDGRPSNFDRLMGRDRYDDYNIDGYYMEEDYRRGNGRRGTGESRYRSGRQGGGRRGRYDDDYYEDYGEGRRRGDSDRRGRRYDGYRDGYGKERNDRSGDGRSSRDKRR